MNKVLIFVARWGLNSLGLWVAVRLLGTGYEGINVTAGLFGFLFAGLVFSIINSVVKPFFILVSLPFILLTLGLFLLIVNGLMVYISIAVTPGIEMSFSNSIITGILLSLVNYIVSASSVLIINKSGQRGI